MRVGALIGVVVMGLVVTADERRTDLANAYRIEFENAWVRVTRVVYEPRQKLPAHTHTPLPSAYVYLNDGPAVRYSHVGSHNIVATRPPTRAGAFRVFRGIDEVHEAENLGDAPSHFLRVEFKTGMRDESAFTARVAPPPAFTTTEAGVEFDHPLTRITRLRIAAGAAIEVDATLPSLVVAFAPAAIDWEGAPAPATLETGQTRWMAAGAGGALRNAGHTDAHLLRLEFRTPPDAH